MFSGKNLSSCVGNREKFRWDLRLSWQNLAKRLLSQGVFQLSRFFHILRRHRSIVDVSLVALQKRNKHWHTLILKCPWRKICLCCQEDAVTWWCTYNIGKHWRLAYAKCTSYITSSWCQTYKPIVSTCINYWKCYILHGQTSRPATSAYKSWWRSLSKWNFQPGFDHSQSSNMIQHGCEMCEAKTKKNCRIGMDRVMPNHPNLQYL